MAIRQDVTKAEGWFTGGTKIFRYTVRDRITGAVRDISAFTAWEWYATSVGAAHGMAKAIELEGGAYELVTDGTDGLLDVEVAGSLTLAKEAKPYEIWLWGTDALGVRDLLAWGTAALQQSPE